jgi:hypothetical protein
LQFWRLFCFGRYRRQEFDKTERRNQEGKPQVKAKNLPLSKVLCGLLTGFICSCQSPSPAPATLCADFSNQMDNATPPPPFPPAFTEAQGHLTFTQLPPAAPAMFFNKTAGAVGLQFSKAGLEITTTPPLAVNHITMRFGTFGSAVKLAAYNGATLVYSQTLNTGNTYQNFTIQTPAPFTKLEFKGGSNEAILVRICINSG